MRNLSTCYSDHAVKVSDSYSSSAYSNRNRSPKPIPSSRNGVVSKYKVKLSSNKTLHVTITWSTKLLCKGFWVNVAENSGSVSVSRLRMASEKGKEIFGACGSTVQLYWDLSKARFDGSGPGPGMEPIGSFYVVVLVDSFLALLLGDMEEDPFVRRLTLGLPIAKSSLISKCEHLSGSTQFTSRVRFCDPGQEHEVVIKCGADHDEGGKALSVMIDKRSVVRVRRLKWNFRGNQVVFVDGLMVDVMWDLNRWMMSDHPTVCDGGYDGVFMFRTRSGLDSRLWVEEKKEEDEFSFLVCVTRSPV